MATLIELCESGQLIPIEPELEENELSWRCLYGTPCFIAWLDTQLPTFPHEEMYAELTPLEQVGALFAEFSSGETFSTDRRFKKLSSTPQHHVWEFKTDDVRIFGWIPDKNKFICCFGDQTETIKMGNSYNRYIAQTKYVRDNLNLDEPKCIIGGRYEDVISTKNKS